MYISDVLPQFSFEQLYKLKRFKDILMFDAVPNFKHFARNHRIDNSISEARWQGTTGLILIN